MEKAFVFEKYLLNELNLNAVICLMRILIIN